MLSNTYTPGYGSAIVKFMSQRTAETHAGFFLPQLKPGWCVLDVGCGPGTITLGLARKTAPGQVIGIDIEDTQFRSAREQAQCEGLNVEFRKASAYELPFEDGSFDAVFSHALLEHLSDPAAAILELRRVLKPGGLIGLRAGDLGGLLLDAVSEGPAQAFGVYLKTQKEGSKDPNVGRKLARLMRNAGFAIQKMTASYEVITDILLQFGPALAQEVAAPGGFCSLRERGGDDSLFVALAWCEATGYAS
jgi:ubiquinone/menaquinone biosynthesis C-methylase UbiE